MEDLRIALLYFLSVPAVKRYPHGCPGIRGHSNLDNHNYTHYYQLHSSNCPLLNTNHDGTVMMLTLISTPAGTTIGLKESEWGQIGVMSMAGVLG